VTAVPRLAFSHMGIFVTDPARMEDFYTRVLGFTVTDPGTLEKMRETAGGKVYLIFLSRNPTEHHQVVLASGRPTVGGFNPINQISFCEEGLAALREMHARVVKENVKELYAISHGNALSVYFHDPEGNRLEIFMDTPWYVRQPLRAPLDLSLGDAGLWAKVEAQASTMPGFKPVA